MLQSQPLIADVANAESWLQIDIATEVGFANQSHLTRHFKRIVGITPRVALDALTRPQSDRKNVPNTART